MKNKTQIDKQSQFCVGGVRYGGIRDMPFFSSGLRYFDKKLLSIRYFNQPTVTGKPDFFARDMVFLHKINGISVNRFKKINTKNNDKKAKRIIK